MKGSIFKGHHWDYGFAAQRVLAQLQQRNRAGMDDDDTLASQAPPPSGRFALSTDLAAFTIRLPQVPRFSASARMSQFPRTEPHSVTKGQARITNRA